MSLSSLRIVRFAVKTCKIQNIVLIACNFVTLKRVYEAPFPERAGRLPLGQASKREEAGVGGKGRFRLLVGAGIASVRGERWTQALPRCSPGTPLNQCRTHNTRKSNRHDTVSTASRLSTVTVRDPHQVVGLIPHSVSLLPIRGMHGKVL